MYTSPRCYVTRDLGVPAEKCPPSYVNLAEIISKAR
jgi:hypothetical protein